MEYVESFNLFGTKVSQIPCIKGDGAPTTTTVGAVGCLYMNTDNGNLYKCTAVADGVYTWVKIGDGGGGGSVDLDATLTQAGMAADAKAVGDRLGDIDAAFDELHAYAQALIGGGSE